MAPRAFDKEYILDWLDDLWKRRDKLAEELDWLYECCIDQMTKKVTRQLIPPHLADKHRQGYEFIYKTYTCPWKTSWVSERSSSTCAWSPQYPRALSGPDRKPLGTARRPPEGPLPFPRRDVNERPLAPPPPPPTSLDRRDARPLGLGTCSRLSK